MLLYILVGSLLPYIETLDSWLFQGTLDDPFDEVFPFLFFIHFMEKSSKIINILDFLFSCAAL